jgi:hypothetical protein
MGISVGISLTVSLLMPFPISLVAIIGTFLLINFYLRKRMMARMNGGGNSYGGVMDGMFGPMQFKGSSVKYHCMNCGMEHKHVACPKCGSKMKKAGL